GGLKGVGELFPEGQQLDIANLHKTDLKACCLEYNLPLLIHTNELVGHYYAGKTSVPLEHIEAFINNHKEIPIILAHFGGGLLFYELMNEIKSNFSNVYYDTAASLFLYNKKIYNVIREIGVMDKILFGSDYPLLPIERYEASLNELSEEEKSKIMGDNALKLLKKCRAL
ncbi:amidohydrolase family protein, partial [Clostridium cadaveris]